MINWRRQGSRDEKWEKIKFRGRGTGEDKYSGDEKINIEGMIIGKKLVSSFYQTLN